MPPNSLGSPTRPRARPTVKSTPACALGRRADWLYFPRSAAISGAAALTGSLMMSRNGSLFHDPPPISRDQMGAYGGLVDL